MDQIESKMLGILFEKRNFDIILFYIQMHIQSSIVYVVGIFSLDMLYSTKKMNHVKIDVLFDVNIN